ncbi:PqqD family protein [Pseudomonadota bacterium]
MSQEVRGETVLLDLSREHYFGLDAIGTRVWQLLREGKSLEQLFDVMLDEFEVGREQLEIDIAAFLENLISAGLISLEISEDL